MADRSFLCSAGDHIAVHPSNAHLLPAIERLAAGLGILSLDDIFTLEAYRILHMHFLDLLSKRYISKSQICSVMASQRHFGGALAASVRAQR